MKMMRKGDWKSVLKKFKVQILCIVSGFVLYGLAQNFMQDENQMFKNQIRRDSYGKYDREQRVLVDGLSEKEIELDVKVSHRQYTKEEISDIFTACMEELEKTILGDNTSLQEIRTKLKLVSSVEKYGVKVRWFPRDTKLIDALGEVFNADLKEAVDTAIDVQLRDGKNKADFVIELRVLPRLYTKEERELKEFTDKLKEIDREQIGKENMQLPGIWNGKKLSYRDPDQTDYSILWILGIAVAILLYARNIADTRTKAERRSKMLVEDYPDIVSKFMILIGAGMSVRTAWENIVDDYRRFTERSKEERPAYVEMERALGMLKTGVNESRVFREFGRKTGQKQYMKLASLFEQNKKAGSAGLKQALSLEAISAWEERLSMARRLGEEAGTKLLGPLFILLGIVMIMIMAPAMLSFY